tara:strand:- start:536 stop:1180 length:645 start_codon:yes stop_codon:yes gene_type:complete
MREILKETFDKIYCINLDSRPDKWKMCVEEFEKYNMLDLVERVPAIYHKNGYIGSTFSHLKCMESAKLNKYKNILILEDDFEFIGSTSDTYVTKALNQLKNISWDMLFFSYKIELPREFIFYKDVSDNLFQSACQLTAAGYGITNKVYNFILNCQKPLLKCSCIDVFYARYLSHKFKCLNIKPMVIGQRNDILSDIRNREVKHKWVNKMLQEYV